jgi:hypothetical protein
VTGRTPVSLDGKPPDAGVSLAMSIVTAAPNEAF